MIYIQNERGENYGLTEKGIIKPNWRSIIWKLDDFWRPIQRGYKFELLIDEQVHIAESRHDSTWIDWVFCLAQFNGKAEKANIICMDVIKDIPEVQGKKWSERFDILESDMQESIVHTQEAQEESLHPYRSRGVSRGMF